MIKRSFAFLFVAAFGLGSWACKPKENVVKIALAVPLTGDIGAVGQGIRRAVEMAIDESNNSKTLPFKVALAVYDDRADPKEAVNVANQIVSDPSVAGVIGHFNSGCSIPTAPLYARAGLIVLSPAASNPQLTLQQLSPQWKWPKTVFRVNTTDDIQGAFAGDFVWRKLQAKTVSVIHDKTAYGQGIAEEFQKKFTALGGQVLSFDGVQVGDKDFKALLTRIKGENPEVLYFGGIYNEGGLLVRQAREIGLKAVFLAGEANYDPEFLRIAGGAAEGAYVTFLGRPPELLDSAKQFVEKYHLRFPQDEVKAYDHYAYEITNMLLEALEKVGPDKAKIVEYLRAIHYKGVLGETSFDEKGDTLNKTIPLFTVKDGKYILAQ